MAQAYSPLNEQGPLPLQEVPMLLLYTESLEVSADCSVGGGRQTPVIWQTDAL